MPSPIFISRPPAGFTLLSVFRGAQLTLLGAYRALLNPDLARHGYYQKAIQAVGISIVVQLILWIPLILFRWTLEFLFYALGASHSEAAESLIDTLRFIQNNVFNVGPLLISGIRFMRPDMDDLFLMSLQFVDKVYKSKHPDTDRQYHIALIQYEKQYRAENTFIRRVNFVEKLVPNSLFPDRNSVATPSSSNEQQPKVPSASSKDNTHPSLRYQNRRAFADFLTSYILRTGTTLLALLFSHAPIIGPVVLPCLSFYSFNNVVGTTAALVVFAVGFMVPRRVMIIFLSSFWGSRSLVRELLAPYFSRVPFSRTQKALWFANREGIMFGFGAGFYFLMKIPFIGVLVYGLAEASSAYLITKVSDPPPIYSVKALAWTESQTVWTANDKVLVSEMNSDGFSSSIPGGWEKINNGSSNAMANIITNKPSTTSRPSTPSSHQVDYR